MIIHCGFFSFHFNIENFIKNNCKIKGLGSFNHLNVELCGRVSIKFSKERVQIKITKKSSYHQYCLGSVKDYTVIQFLKLFKELCN